MANLTVNETTDKEAHDKNDDYKPTIRRRRTSPPIHSYKHMRRQEREKRRVRLAAEKRATTSSNTEGRAEVPMPSSGGDVITVTLPPTLDEDIRRVLENSLQKAKNEESVLAAGNWGCRFGGGPDPTRMMMMMRPPPPPPHMFYGGPPPPPFPHPPGFCGPQNSQQRFPPPPPQMCPMAPPNDKRFNLPHPGFLRFQPPPPPRNSADPYGWEISRLCAEHRIKSALGILPPPPPVSGIPSARHIQQPPMIPGHCNMMVRAPPCGSNMPPPTTPSNPQQPPPHMQ